jgi:hypothetical protein
MGEAHTQIQQQVSDMQQQQMALQDKAQTLMMVQQRAMEIASGGGQAVGQGAPPMPPPGGGGMPQPAAQSTMGGMNAAATTPEGMASMRTEAPSATEIQQQVNPQFLDQAGQLSEQFQDPSAFDAAAIASMAQAPSFRNMVVEYVPTLERALDNLGRVLLTTWMQEKSLKDDLGDEEFGDVEDNLRAVFEGLGALILQINRNAIVMDSN